MTRVAVFTVAAMLELPGCYLMWIGQKQSGLLLWLGGIAVLAGFGLVLAQVTGSLPGRAYAAYGGIYIAAASGVNCDPSDQQSHLAQTVSATSQRSAGKRQLLVRRRLAFARSQPPLTNALDQML